MNPQTVLATIILMLMSSLPMACTEAANLTDEAVEPTAVTDEAFAEAEQFIQGEWSFSEEIDEGFHASYSYIFEDGTVRFSGYPPLQWNGRYRILSTKNSSITLELYDLEDEDGAFDNYTIDLTIDPEETTLLIGTKGPFTQ
ncbi:MAG: hypothetical protein GY805_33835 [Chloroflexi bacterium]|nr:hypothetical protein [Chloroflexota bacterium]